MTALPEVTEVQRLTLSPGDRIVVRVPGRLDKMMAAYVTNQVRRGLRLPDSVPVLVLDDGASLEVAEGP